MDQIHVLGIAGSLRRGSFNRALLHAAIRQAPEYVTISEYPINGIRFYNADLDTDLERPIPVVEF